VFALFVSFGLVADLMANQACPADVAPQPLGDGMVNNLDLMAIIDAWESDDCRYDIAPPGGDGIVNNLDMALVVSSWGNCPTADLGACWVNNACSELSRSACQAAGGLAWEPVPCTDSDGDFIPSVFERNDCQSPCGIYVGTNPEVADTDGDGLSDGLEVFGLLDGGGTINLPELGANPLRKTLFLEIDWMEHAPSHQHRPSATAITNLQTAFEDSPAVNPCHSSGTGIDLIIDYGQGGLFTGGNQITVCPDGICAAITWNQFQDLKVVHLAPERLGVFYYSLHCHTNLTYPDTSGVAQINGDDHMITLAVPTDKRVAMTIMHEFGHNLGLYHGGNQCANGKPNYPSIMNYRYSGSGVDTNCDAVGDGALDYSRGVLADLDEHNLLETVGMCGMPIDWNRDHVIQQTPYAYNLTCGVECNETCTVNSDICGLLSDHDDWSNLSLSDVTGPGGNECEEGATISCELPSE
jgi:hypothetical protein